MTSRETTVGTMPNCTVTAPEEKACAEEIDEIVRRIAERFNPHQIILFGSHARGTARADSDVDLLVVMPVTGSKREQQIEIRCALHDIHVAKDIVVATPDEVERRRNIVGTIIRPALREGKVLYARGR
jgi:predicted nucleotidyltransferase